MVDCRRTAVGAGEDSRVDLSSFQQYLRQAAATAYEAVHLPGFTLFLHATNDRVHLNYAIPDTDWAGHASSSIPALCRAFETRGRVPRFEFVEEVSPLLPKTLVAGGFHEEYRGPAMACVRADHTSAPDVSGLVIDRVSDGSPEDALRAMATTQAKGFGAAEDWRASDADVADLRGFLASGQGFIGRIDGDVVCVSQLAASHDGIAELVGVATLPAFRRRGLATAVTGAATAAAYECGVDAVCLSAGDEESARMYERVGYRTVATMLAYSRE
jgi:ribosomal protein S18 acetylase RimI-like enzyme